MKDLKVNDYWKYMKIIYVHCDEEMSDPRSYEHYETRLKGVFDFFQDLLDI